jgi:hypothetical protein
MSLNLVASVHPCLHSDVLEPVRHGRDATAAVFLNMLFTDVPDRNFATI